jgi:hypothetical protein
VTTPPRMSLPDMAAPPIVATLQSRSLLIGGVLSLVSIIGAFVQPSQFFRSYLLAYMLALGATLGCMGWLMLIHLAGGRWGFVIRRILEAGTRTFWLTGPLVVPLIIGMALGKLYPWTNVEEMFKDPATRHLVQKYMNPMGFTVRSLAYLVVFGIIIFFLNHWSRAQDDPPVQDIAGRYRNLSAPGLLLYGYLIGLAAVDWVMSLDPHWTSTIYGLIFLAGEMLIAMCVVIGALAILTKFRPMAGIVTAANLKDYGNFTLTFVMVWAYFSFSQWLIIWAGNQPDEITWYSARLRGGWNYVGTWLMIFHFAVPFALLLSRDLKKNTRKLAMLAGWLVLMRWLDLLWNIEPSFHASFFISWLDITLPLGMGGLWMWLFWRNLGSRPLMPLYDPRTQLTLEEVHEHEQQ